MREEKLSVALQYDDCLPASSDREMRNKFIVSVWIVCLLMFLADSCSKESAAPTVITGETPCSSLVASKSVTIGKYSTSYSGSLGYEFKTTADGHVTGFGLASPVTGTFGLVLYKVDSVSKTGTVVASQSLTLAVGDTAAFKFKYVSLSSKVAILKGVYYRVVANGAFSNYDYITIPFGTLPLTSPSEPKFKFTKGVYGLTYPDGEFTGFIFPADVVIQFP